MEVVGIIFSIVISIALTFSFLYLHPNPLNNLHNNDNDDNIDDIFLSSGI